MTRAFRDALDPVIGNNQHCRIDGHPGLRLHRYLPEPVAGGDKTRYVELMEAIGKAPTPAGYDSALARWRATLASLPGVTEGVSMGELPVADGSRLAIGLGEGGVRENGLSLNHLWGMPLIRGTALKGLARRYARRRVEDHPAGSEAARWVAPTPEPAADEGEADADRPRAPREPRVPRDAMEALFGATDLAAHVEFHDAWWVPSAAGGPFARDVLTPHHRRYNSDQGRADPSDFDDPEPHHFLVARGTFLIAVSGPDDAWAGLAFRVLADALAEWGVGAKTSSGYGRLGTVSEVSDSGQDIGPEPADPMTAFSQRAAKLLTDDRRVKENAGAVVQDWEQVVAGLEESDDTPAARAAALAAIEAVIARATQTSDLRKAWAGRKYRERIMAAIEKLRAEEWP